MSVWECLVFQVMPDLPPVRRPALRGGHGQPSRGARVPHLATRADLACAGGTAGHGRANRRVKGLRREEVALLAGVSIDYYVRMERGNLAGASEAVLDGLASALQLDEAERAHLFDLARAAQPAFPPTTAEQDFRRH